MNKILLSAIAASTLTYAAQSYDLSLTFGGTHTTSDLNHADHKNYGIRFGIPNEFLLDKTFDTLEFAYERSNDVDYDYTMLETNINRYSINMLAHSYDYGNIVPYGLVGLGYEDFSKEYLNTNDSVTLNLGMGIKYFLNEAWYVRGEIRDQINLEDDIEHSIIYTAGLGFSFGEKAVKQPEPVEEKKEAPKKSCRT